MPPMWVPDWIKQMKKWGPEGTIRDKFRMHEEMSLLDVTYHSGLSVRICREYLEKLLLEGFLEIAENIPRNPVYRLRRR